MRGSHLSSQRKRGRNGAWISIDGLHAVGAALMQEPVITPSHVKNVTAWTFSAFKAPNRLGRIG
jgi:hypothetical protein